VTEERFKTMCIAVRDDRLPDLHSWEIKQYVADIRSMAKNHHNYQRDDLDIMISCFKSIKSEIKIRRMKAVVKRYEKEIYRIATTYRWGCIYILNSDHGCKIGKTNNPHRRLKEFMRMKLPFEFTMEKKYFIKDYHNVERQLHSDFDFVHLRGEWFDLDDWCLNDIDNTLTEITYKDLQNHGSIAIK